MSVDKYTSDADTHVRNSTRTVLVSLSEVI